MILAAGRGSRLGSLGADTPKWLLRVGEETIAERQLHGIAEARAATGREIAGVTVVAGHALSDVAGFAGRQEIQGVGVLENPDYEEINNWYSVLLALRSLPPDPATRVVVINADLFARAAWYASFITAAAATREESLIAVDLERELTDESMKVSVRPDEPGLLEAIGKVEIEGPVGEYVGMLMARGPVLKAFREQLESFCGREESRNEWYERGVGLSAAAGVAWRVWPTPDSDWVEIDDDADFHRAEQLAREL